MVREQNIEARSFDIRKRNFMFQKEFREVAYWKNAGFLRRKLKSQLDSNDEATVQESKEASLFH